MTQSSYLSETKSWQTEREQKLRSPYGWLATAGLFWLEEGENRMGSGAENPVYLPPGAAPEYAGVFIRRGDEVTLHAAPGVEIRLGEQVIHSASIPVGAQSSEAFYLGDMKFFILRRGARFGVRIFDPHNPALREFSGLQWFPIDARWRVTGRFRPFGEPRTLPILNLLGDLEPMPFPGVVEFSLEGCMLNCDLIEVDEGRLWLLFRDQTNGVQTYPAGRYLTCEPPQQDQVILDFNRAYNPPCAFTAFATCPLPPKNNHIPIAVPAGEQFYGINP